MRESNDFVDVTLVCKDCRLKSTKWSLLLKVHTWCKRRLNCLRRIPISWRAQRTNYLVWKVLNTFHQIPFYRIFIIFYSPWVVQWLTRRAEEGLNTISRIGIDATFKVSTMLFVFCSNLLLSSPSSQSTSLWSSSGVPWEVSAMLNPPCSHWR